MKVEIYFTYLLPYESQYRTRLDLNILRALAF